MYYTQDQIDRANQADLDRVLVIDEAKREISGKTTVFPLA